MILLENNYIEEQINIYCAENQPRLNDFNEKIQIDRKEFEIWTKEITDNLNYPGARSSKPNKLDFMERAAYVYFGNFNCNNCFIL